MKYRVLITEIGKEDVEEKKRYILRNFKYREYADNFSKEIKGRYRGWIHYRTVMALPVFGIGDMTFI